MKMWHRGFGGRVPDGAVAHSSYMLTAHSCHLKSLCQLVFKSRATLSLVSLSLTLGSEFFFFLPFVYFKLPKI